MDNKTKIYAAYGSNMNLRQMAQRCPNAKVIGKGQMKDYRLIFRGNGYANIEKCVGRTVPIVLWEITETCEKNLDFYEGFPSHYTKISSDIMTENGIISAMVYVMERQHAKVPAIPSSHYLKTISDGYQENGISLKYLAQAYEESFDAFM